MREWVEGNRGIEGLADLNLLHLIQYKRMSALDDIFAGPTGITKKRGDVEFMVMVQARRSAQPCA